MTDQTKLVVGALGVGALVFFLLKRGGSGATILSPQAPDTSALTAARSQAFGALASAAESLGLAQKQSERDIALANIQAGVARYQADAAVRTATLTSAQNVAAIKAANSGKGWQTAGQFIRDAGQGIRAVIGGNSINFGPRYPSSYGGGVSI